jgi:hypothetical protein
MTNIITHANIIRPYANGWAVETPATVRTYNRNGNLMREIIRYTPVADFRTLAEAKAAYGDIPVEYEY